MKLKILVMLAIFGLLLNQSVIAKNSDFSKKQFAYNNLGYRQACWTCYDGYSECQGYKTSCKLSETWMQYAEESCKGHGGKCGVNGFEVYSDCKNGFRKAYWSCYDGYEQSAGGETSCKSAETWREYAEESCKGHCQKAGVNSFFMFNTCRYSKLH